MLPLNVHCLLFQFCYSVRQRVPINTFSRQKTEFIRAITDGTYNYHAGLHVYQLGIYKRPNIQEGMRCCCTDGTQYEAGRPWMLVYSHCIGSECRRGLGEGCMTRSSGDGKLL